MAALALRSVTIASSATTSDAVDCDGSIPVAIQFPTMTGTSVTFEVSLDGGATFVALYDTDGAAISYTIVDDSVMSLDPGVFAGCDQIKLVSSATEAAQRSITVALHRTFPIR